MSMEFKIENIRVRVPEGYYDKYPLEKLKVGQSFLVTDLGPEMIQSFRTYVSAYGKRHGAKFAVVRAGGGYRCGRIG
jgi:hypothetical protein